MGFKLKDNAPKLPNLDPLRAVELDNNLPPEACEVPSENELNYLQLKTNQYYLAPGLTIEEAELLYQRAVTPLFRKVRC
jgi:hypothetical protein